jgi:hypothetical protein
MECLVACSDNMTTVPQKMVGLRRMSHYRGVGLERFHCASLRYT